MTDADRTTAYAKARRHLARRDATMKTLTARVGPCTRATIGLGFTILVAAVLGFLGMGATPPAPDWGLTIAESRTYLPRAWWYATFPGLAIMVTVLAINLLGDGLRDALDPRQKQRGDG